MTPRALLSEPIHRWYTFPHSFTHQLVNALAEEWRLGRSDLIIDPFVGAGTTVLAAKIAGIPAQGHDLSPLAVFVSRVKSAQHDPSRAQGAWSRLRPRLEAARWEVASGNYPPLVTRAIPPRTLGVFEGISRAITRMRCPEPTKELFHLALLATMPDFSRAVATGGWLSWVGKARKREAELLPTFKLRVGQMLEDISISPLSGEGCWGVSCADARRLPEPDSTASAAITSPPYPNRHDYTRVFGVELMYRFLDWEGTRNLRRQSFQSHPESRPERPDPKGYSPPGRLSKLLGDLRRAGVEEKIRGMIEGYFVDIFLCLCELRRVCKPGAPVALVLGNARYAGIPVMVDELTAEIGEQAGLRCERIRAVRFRGNSAQQMGAFGRSPSRESIVIFRNLKRG